VDIFTNYFASAYREAESNPKINDESLDADFAKMNIGKARDTVLHVGVKRYEITQLYIDEIEEKLAPVFSSNGKYGQEAHGALSKQVAEFNKYRAAKSGGGGRAFMKPQIEFHIFVCVLHF
jgi:hypothetical protein